MKRVVIIGGSGKMGQWFARLLKQEGKEVVITGRSEQKLREVGEQLGVETSTSLDVVKDADAVLISVPIDNFEEVVKQLQPYVHSGQTVIDITSIKVKPLEIMHKYLGAALVLGTHPVFGPGAKGVANQNFVLTPTSEPETALAEKVKRYLEERGGRVTLMTPREHDEMMAVILALSHFIALVSADALMSFGASQQMEAIGGSTYKLLLTLVKSVITEDPEFYASLQMNIPNATVVEELFQKRVGFWAQVVKDGDREEFARRMTALREKLEKVDPDFRKAYQNMYRLLE